MAYVPKPTRAKYLVTATRTANQTTTDRGGSRDARSPPVHTPSDEQGRPKIQKSLASSAVPFTPPPKIKLGPGKKETNEDATGATRTSASAANTDVSHDGTMETKRRKRSRDRPMGPDNSEPYLPQYLVPEPRPTRAKHLVIAMTSSASKPTGATEPSVPAIDGASESNCKLPKE